MIETVVRTELFPFFAELSSAGRREFSAIATVQAQPKKPLLRRGDDAGGAYLVVRGLLRVYYLREDGREATLYRVEPGGTCVLALGATLQREPYPAWVQAGPRGASFACVPSAVFDGLIEREPAFRDFVLRSMSSRIFELMHDLEELATASVVERVAALLVRRVSPIGEVAVTQAELAAELGTAREVVSRALRELARRRLVSSTRGRIRVLDARALSSSAATERTRGSRPPLLASAAPPRR